jgi:hypothetical protein
MAVRVWGLLALLPGTDDGGHDVDVNVEMPLKIFSNRLKQSLKIADRPVDIVRYREQMTRFLKNY